ncbi:MAG: RNA repair domain-containing protein [Candidatus Thermoplasmatota archaeon]|nr:RNA repair domain-containing protein [Candidatus Thermoplasmatota archaeon]
MATSTDVLHEQWWRTDRDFLLVEFDYVDRGAPGDVSTVTGSMVEKLEKSFFVLVGDTRIPYHRILEIRYGGEVLFSRRA